MRCLNLHPSPPRYEQTGFQIPSFARDHPRRRAKPCRSLRQDWRHAAYRRHLGRCAMKQGPDTHSHFRWCIVGLLLWLQEFSRPVRTMLHRLATISKSIAEKPRANHSASIALLLWRLWNACRHRLHTTETQQAPAAAAAGTAAATAIFRVADVPRQGTDLERCVSHSGLRRWARGQKCCSVWLARPGRVRATALWVRGR